MKNAHELGQDQFDALLALFSVNRDEAGEKYEQIRRGLVRYFHFKGCHDPQSLTDETINRVAAKAHEFDYSKQIKPTSYVYGFASNVLLEYRRTAGKELSITENQFPAGEIDGEAEDIAEAKSACLKKCLDHLPPGDKDLIIKYFAREGREKIELRQAMCDELGCTAAALHTRVFRIKAGLKKCIEECMKESS